MPRGDGTGPTGKGPKTGQCGRGMVGGGRGRNGGFSAGPAGECVCPKCKHTQAHARGVPCSQIKCPKCGTIMTRNI